MAPKWECEKTIQFIREYKSHDCLWNFKSVDYKNRHMREAAYQQIVKAMNIQGFKVADVKSKIKNLRSTYCQEMKKIEDSKKIAASAVDVDGSHRVNQIYKSNIKWLKELETIYKDANERKIHDNMEEDSTLTQTESPVSRETVNEGATLRVEKESYGGTREETPSRLRKKKQQRVKRIVRAAIADLKSLQKSIKCESDEDAFDIFGRSIAMQLKKLSQESALRAQSKIQNLLTEFGIEDLREKNRQATSGDIPLSVTFGPK